MQCDLVVIFGLILTVEVEAQYPFEKFPAAPLQVTDSWTGYDKNDGKFYWILAFPNFYSDSSSMTVQITTFPKSDSSLFRIYRARNKYR